MITAIATLVALIIAGVLFFANSRPNNFRVQRSVRVKAAPEAVFPLINDFKQWEAWSPWEKLDPALKRTYGETTTGIGAVYGWEGNNQVGTGRMEITSTTPPSLVVIKLDFFKPFEGHNTAEFTLNAKDGMTEVTWAMFGPSPFVSKLMGLFFSMDKMIGKSFEDGLAKMKAIAEA